MEEVDLTDDSPVQKVGSDIDLGGGDVADEAPDPRIQVELEKLNTSTDTINKLEVDLDEARMLFRQLLADSTQRIDVLAKRLGKCVEQSRPYYEARIRAKQALSETQKAAVRYERAMSQHAAAREMVFLAEEGLMQKGCTFDHTWQEMLNHATSKVNDAEREKIESAADHRRTSALYHEAETRVKSLQKELKRAIAKSSLNARRSLLQLNNLARMHQLQLLPYFELKAAINQQLEAQKQKVRQLEESVTTAKLTYAQALTNLETISDEIHRTRQSQLDLGVRGVGVGAESPLPPLQAVDGGMPLTANPLHYAGSSLDSDTQDDYKALPEKLGPAATPIMSSVMTPEATRAILARTPSTSGNTTLTGECISATTVSQTLTSAPSIPTGANDVTLNSVVLEADDVVVEEVDGATACTDLTGWQVIGLGGPALSSAQYLTVEDRDSTISDTESLASIEMLSDEAIAGLMLDEELAEASNAMGTPLNTPISDIPFPTTTSMCPWPTLIQNYVTSSQQVQETVSVSNSLPTFEKYSEDFCSSVSNSMGGLKLEDSFPPATRQLKPPHSLPLSNDSSSEHSSPEDLTPGYVPLKNVCTPFSPEDFVPSSKVISSEPTPPSSTSSEEAKEEHHRSSWVMENVPDVKEKPSSDVKP